MHHSSALVHRLLLRHLPFRKTSCRNSLFTITRLRSLLVADVRGLVHGFTPARPGKVAIVSPRQRGKNFLREEEIGGNARARSEPRKISATPRFARALFAPQASDDGAPRRKQQQQRQRTAITPPFLTYTKIFALAVDWMAAGVGKKWNGWMNFGDVFACAHTRRRGRPFNFPSGRFLRWLNFFSVLHCCWRVDRYHRSQFKGREKVREILSGLILFVIWIFPSKNESFRGGKIDRRLCEGISVHPFVCQSPYTELTVRWTYRWTD